MSNYIRKLRRSLAIHGVLGTLKLLFALTIKPISLFHAAELNNRQENDLDYDKKWGVDTGGNFVPVESQVVGTSWLYGSKYQGTNATSLNQILNELPINHENFTFIDLGSGKGRAILEASRFPFKKIIGVEHAIDLNEIAKKNILQFPDDEKKCKIIDIVCDDAKQFTFPGGPLMLYLFNPFRNKVMIQVVNNVLKSFKQNPRKIIVIYHVPVHADIWDNANFMTKIKAANGIVIYDTQI